MANNNVLVNGFGYRRTGTVIRPGIEFVNQMDVEIVHLSVVTALLVPENVFEIEVELLESPDLEVSFTSMLDATVEEGEPE